MAGGEGRRLLPLTETMPKPLVPVGGEPAMTHILRLLRRHGVSEAAVTTGYLAGMIEERYGSEFEGIRLNWFREDTPLGTAGGVKAASKNFDSDFFVISGDAVCELDLSRALEFHRCSGADATIILSHAESPLEYGLVLCGPGGRVERFVEKPSLSQAYTDTVNTGVYILNPRIMEFIPDGEFYDFGRDLFPELLKRGAGLFAVPDRGYWCDIGDLEAYYRANMYCSSGDSVIGMGCSVSGGATVESSVIFDGVRVGEGCVVRESVIGTDCDLRENCVINEGCVLGEGCVVGRGAVLAPGTRLAAFTRVPDGYIKRETSLFRSIAFAERIFASNGIVCPEGDFTTAFTVRLGRALAAAADKGRVGVMYGGGGSESRICGALIRGLRLGGSETVPLGVGFEAACAYAPPALRLELSLFVRVSDGTVTVSMYDRDGIYPHRSFERALTASLISSEKDVVGYGIIEDGGAAGIPGICFTESCYFPALTASAPELTGLVVSVRCENKPAMLLQRAFLALGASVGGDGLELSVGDDGFSLKISQSGFEMDMNHAVAAILASGSETDSRPVALPYTAPEKLKKLAGTGLRCYSRCPHDKSEDEARNLVKLRPELSDALFCALRTASLIKPGMSLAGLMLSYQDFAFLNEEMKLSDGKRKIAVMSALGVPAGDGIYIEYERGGVRVIPEGGGFALSAESASGEYAAEIMELSKKRISELISEFEGK